MGVQEGRSLEQVDATASLGRASWAARNGTLVHLCQGFSNVLASGFQS